jgi:hypothetical protein
LLNLWTSRYRFYRKHYHPIRVWLARQIVHIGLERQAAAGQERLTEAELADRRRCYQRIVDIWRGKSSES